MPRPPEFTPCHSIFTLTPCVFRRCQPPIPAEIYFGVEPAHKRGAQPARGKLAAPCVVHHIEVDYLEGDRRFPYLKRAA